MLTIATAPPALAQQETFNLHDGPPAGSENWKEPLVVQCEDGREVRYNTTRPKLRAFLPEPDKADGAAVVMLPGGGLRQLSIGIDMHDTIAMLNEEGVAVILLEYRTLQLSPEQIAKATAPRPASSAPVEFPKMEIRNANANPSPDDPAMKEVLRFAVADGQTALRFVRSRAEQWHIDPDRVGMFGTSAGGGVAFGTMMAGADGALPNFIVSNFGPALQDITVPHDAPPLFLVTEAGHGPVADGLVALFQMWIDQRKPAELHVYDVPNFTMTPDLWGARLIDWMYERGLIKGKAK